ncbi:MAG TPA: tRNA lysidine(34) synthetase TilS [Gemmatales bacterium]|nr:tRNA lysidine(34) synthetase TilS [Gemmatales bacterium]
MSATLLHHLNRALQRPLLQGRVVVAVSGGSDSVALLHALHQLNLSKLQLHVAHYNHKLRSNSSDADAEYVKNLCQQLAIPFHIGLAQQGELRADQSHLESQARKFRYQWLLQLTEQLNSQWVFTAHTLNDQAETVLHHLIRGTGWRGLRGIAPVRMLMRNESSIRIFRPLLKCTRQEVLDYITQQQLTPCHDTSNNDMQFTRNRIRHQVLPQLIEINPKTVPHLAEWATTARVHYEQLRGTAKLLLSGMITHRSSTQFAITRGKIADSEDEFLQELLRLAWRKQRWPVDQMNFKRWGEAIEVCRGTRNAVELPGRIMVKSKDLVIQFIKRE